MQSPTLPPRLQRLTEHYLVSPVTHGRSNANVFRLERAGDAGLFLKTAPPAGAASLRAEAERLDWLHGKVPVPKLVDFVEDSNGAYLLTTTVPGRALIAFNNENDAVKQHMTVLLAEALSMLHAVDVTSYPFQPSGRDELPSASSENAATDYSKKAAILLELQACAPRLPKAALTHGDPCLPNVLVIGDELSGFVDLGSARIGDPSRDLALALWSLDYNYGAGWEDTFLEAYENASVGHEGNRPRT